MTRKFAPKMADTSWESKAAFTPFMAGPYAKERLCSFPSQLFYWATKKCSSFGREGSTF
jgi:hypothetical protein